MAKYANAAEVRWEYWCLATESFEQIEGFYKTWNGYHAT